MTETAYVTHDPETVAAMREAMATYRAWGSALAPAAAALGKNQGALGSAGLGSEPRIHGLKPDDPADPPEGWIYRKGQDMLVPRNGAPGEGARAWLRRHCTPPKRPSKVLIEHGMPPYSGTPVRGGQHSIHRAEITPTPDAVHVLHRGDITNGLARLWGGLDEMHERWQPEPLSAYHLARETQLAQAPPA